MKDDDFYGVRDTFHKCVNKNMFRKILDILLKMIEMIRERSDFSSNL